MIWFWSDTHFNHEGIITFCKRPFAGVDEMNEAMIEAWNSTVGKSDTIYMVGDFAFKPLLKGIPLSTLFQRLKGKKHLVVGNHDEKNKENLRLPWTSISWIAFIKDQKRRVMACHYPMETWRNSHSGSVMVHGHCHGTLKRMIPHRFDVGADVWPKPVSFDHLWGIAASQKFESTDGHEEREQG